MQETSDEQLVRAFQRGDEGAFEVFVKRHQDRVFRLAGLWLYDSSQAVDVLQETLLRSYTGLGRYRFRAQPATWLMRVCRNVCREFNRQRRFDALATESPAFSFKPDYGDGLDHSPGPASEALGARGRRRTQGRLGRPGHISAGLTDV